MDTKVNKGLFVGFIGVPGVGKSTLAAALANKLGADVFIEPGEEHWPVDPKQWQQHVNEIEKWLCKTNAQYFSQARKIADEGGKAVADAGIFLVNSKIVENSAFDYWYGHLNPEQKQNFNEQSKADRANPKCHPDIMVLINADKKTWLEFLKKRGRSYDSDDKNITSYDAQRLCMQAAAEEFAHSCGIKFTCFSNQFGNAEMNADRLLEQLGIVLSS